MNTNTYDLNGTVLNVAANICRPFCDLAQRGDKYELIESIEYQMMKTLADKFNFKYQIVNAEQKWGRFHNGNWSGAIGLLVNKTADLSIACLSRTTNRLQVVDFTIPYFTVPVTFISVEPGVKSRTLLIITTFTTRVWVSIILLFISITILIQFINRKTKICENCFDSILTSLLAALLQQSNIKVSSSNTIRILFGVWFLWSMIVMKIYSGQYNSLVSVPEHDPPVDNLEDLVSAAVSGDYDILLTSDSSHYLRFTRAECCGPFHQIGHRVNRSSPMPKTAQKGIELVARGDKNRIYIDDLNQLVFAKRSNATVDMHIGSDTLFVDFLGMAVQKGSQLLGPMDRAIQQFVENGLFSYWFAETLRSVHEIYHESELKEMDPINNTSVADIQSVFYVCFATIFVSFVAFIAEKFAKRLKRLKSLIN